MKRAILPFVCTLPLLATQGDNLVGAGVKSRAAAGIAYTRSYGVESLFVNPAQITQNPHDELSAGLTLFWPTVHAKNGSSWQRSKEDFETIPYFGIVRKIDASSAWGVGLFGVSGMGVDYSGAPASANLAKVQTKLAYAKLALDYARDFGDLRIGAGIDLAYGRLRIATALSPLPSHYRHDLGAGYHIGIDYQANSLLSFAATYTSKVALRYDSLYDFDGDGVRDDFKLAQPSQYSLAVGIDGSPWHLEIDYARTLWSRARGYGDFAWQDQDIYGISYSYDLGNIKLVAGYSYASAAIKPSKFRSSTQAFFDLVGFPAITRSHYSLGASIELRKRYRLNTAILYAPQAQVEYGTIGAKNRQFSLSIGIDYLF